jgi:hypothetical protein
MNSESGTNVLKMNAAPGVPEAGAEKRASILEMAGGAISERVDYEMGSVIRNILDENTAPAKPRKLTLELTFTPSPDRGFVQVSSVVKVKLEPTTRVQTSLFTYAQVSGGRVFVENTPQIPGQLDMTGSVQEDPKILKFSAD